MTMDNVDFPFVILHDGRAYVPVDCLHLLPEYREMQRELEVLRVERDHLARQVERWRGELPI